MRTTKNLLKLIIIILTIAIITLSTVIFIQKNKNTEQTVFIWNDDEESIPMDNSLITLEFTKDNIIYIGPYDSKAKTD